MQETRGCKINATSFLAPGLAGAGAGAPGRPVVVEVCLLRCTPGGQLAYRSLSGQLAAAETPDEAAARIGRITPAGPGAAVAVHSTSWRPLDDGSIVLTYVVAPDPEPGAAATPIVSFEAAHGPSATRPSPARVRQEQVAAHAARHLALVADTSPTVRLALSAHPALNQALAMLPRTAPGQLPG